MANANHQNAERVPVMLRGANVLSEFRDALFDASNREGVSPNEYALQAAAEKLIRSGRHIGGLFEAGDLQELGL